MENNNKSNSFSIYLNIDPNFITGLIEQGLNILHNISKTISKNRKFIPNTYYSSNHTIKNSVNYIPIDGHYINGFIAGDGCLTICLGKRYFGIMRLRITQHI